MHDPLWFRILLTLHIAAGFLSFLIAPIALCTAKGGPAHRRWGKIYFWAMACVAASALVLACYRPVLFLALVAVFSFYSAFIGYRVLKMKRIASNPKQDLRLDWAVGGTTFLASLSLAAFAVFRPVWIQNMTIPGVVFGLLGMSISGQTMRVFLHPSQDKMFWFYAHLRGMIGSYIAAWTAFCVVTLGRVVGGGWMLWVLPTAIGVPAIVLTTAYYERKFSGKKRMVVFA
jgi:uncharacterized membrane protein